MFLFDEMHIISTDHELRPGLTLEQVTKDIFLSLNIYSSITALVLAVMCAFALLCTKPANSSHSRSTTRFAVRLTFSCWLILCVGPFLSAVYYLLEIRQRLS